MIQILIIENLKCSPHNPPIDGHSKYLSQVWPKISKIIKFWYCWLLELREYIKNFPKHFCTESESHNLSHALFYIAALKGKQLLSKIGTKICNHISQKLTYVILSAHKVLLIIQLICSRAGPLWRNNEKTCW